MNRRKYIGALGMAITSIAGCTSEEESATVATEAAGESPSSEDSSTKTTADDETATETTISSPQSATIKLGEIVKDDSLAMVVREVRKTEKIGEFQKSESGNTYEVVRLAVKNITQSEFVGFSGLLQTRLKDSAGYTYDQSFASTGQTLTGGQLAPGEVARGDLVYEVPKDASGLLMQFDFQAISFFDFDRVKVQLGNKASQIKDLTQNLNVKTYQPGTAVEFEGPRSLSTALRQPPSWGASQRQRVATSS